METVILGMGIPKSCHECKLHWPGLCLAQTSETSDGKVRKHCLIFPEGDSSEWRDETCPLTVSTADELADRALQMLEDADIDVICGMPDQCPEDCPDRHHPKKSCWAVYLMTQGKDGKDEQRRRDSESA